jgi:uncharacterized protein
MNILSPCTGVCKLDGNDICTGCFRSKDEIVYWMQMNDRETFSAIAALDGRRKIFAPAGQCEIE